MACGDRKREVTERAKCCKLGRTRLVKFPNRSPIYFWLREDLTDVPGFTFCPWCGREPFLKKEAT